MDLLAQARSRGIPVWGEVELASRLTPARFLGITGTNGKSTTTSLLGAMLEAAGFPVVVAGNIGTALCEVVTTLGPSHWVVAELVQLPAGDDRDVPAARGGPPQPGAGSSGPVRGSRDDYYAAKARIFLNQTAEDFAVLNADDPPTLEWARGIRSQPRLFSRMRTVGDGAFVRDGRLVVRREGRTEAVCGRRRDPHPGAAQSREQPGRRRRRVGHRRAGRRHRRRAPALPRAAAPAGTGGGDGRRPVRE